MNAETVIDMLCEAALMARHSRIPRLEQNRHERAGRFLLNTCRHTADGEPDSRFAVCSALDAGEPAAAELIADLLLVPLDTSDAGGALTCGIDRTRSVCGEIEVSP